MGDIIKMNEYNNFSNNDNKNTKKSVSDTNHLNIDKDF